MDFFRFFWEHRVYGGIHGVFRGFATNALIFIVFLRNVLLDYEFAGIIHDVEVEELGI